MSKTLRTVLMVCITFNISLCFQLYGSTNHESYTLFLHDDINCTLNVDIIDFEQKTIRITIMVDDNNENNNIRNLKAIGDFTNEKYKNNKYIVTKDFSYKNIQQIDFFTVEHRFKSHVYMKFYTSIGFGRIPIAKILYLSTNIPPRQVVHYKFFNKKYWPD